MALSQQEKDARKAEFNQMIETARKFRRGSVEDLYVIDGDQLIQAAEELGALTPQLTKAAWVRGKQGHGR